VYYYISDVSGKHLLTQASLWRPLPQTSTVLDTMLDMVRTTDMALAVDIARGLTSLGRHCRPFPSPPQSSLSP